ncbi:hypothetical protein BV898_03319 [Hypsibius exemplaris]|uniref:Uncharacterized protein n=1 Tax=Hypsibius exemplaris TaxID=2072580 RepID=A0A1W0X653_HYPEX|nr:hypothetical protein BV898_03319 [Hypsibius exemplaris]
MAGTYYYGGIQIILGIVIAITAMTIGAEATTVALYVGLVLTGLYSLLGSKYLKDTEQVLNTYRDSNYNPVLLPLHLERFLRLRYQFTCVYIASTVILIGLGLASFIQGTISYFSDPNYISNIGSTPAVSGIAAVLVNLFISACLTGEIRRMRLGGATLPTDRPRSPTPNSPGFSDRPSEVSTVSSRVGEAFPPAYAQIDFSVKDADVEEDLPPPYVQAVALPGSSLTNGQPDTREIIISPALLQRTDPIFVASELPHVIDIQAEILEEDAETGTVRVGRSESFLA